MAFLSDFGTNLLSQLNQNLGLENQSGDLTGYETDLLQRFVNRLNSFEQRIYLEDGAIRAKKPRNFEVWMQEPEITVLVKKRHFTSLAENYRPDLMPENEKIFLRAIKKLFQNKCQIISAYERLSKIERIVKDQGMINETVFSMLFASLDVINNFSPNLIDEKTKNILETIRKIKIFSSPNYTTTWITDPSITSFTETGEGTGVIELTMVESLETTTSINFGEGSASLSITDPYKLMVITTEDIERAISEVTSFSGQNSFFRTIIQQSQITIQDLQNQLNLKRLTRGASKITFRVNEYALASEKLIAIAENFGIPIKFSLTGGLLGFSQNFVLYQDDLTENEKFTSEEEVLFSKTVEQYYLMFSLKEGQAVNLKTFNKSTNEIRKKMLLEFGGKCLIQPMDKIHIYISSKTLKDKRINQGMNSSFTADSLLNNLNKQINSFENSISGIKSFFGSQQNSYLEQEKNNFVGSQFPTWLWLILRNQITHQSAAVHVFGGVVQNPSHSYNNGNYSLRISAQDQTAYFKAGQININPSVEVFNGDLYDPLTPFKTNFNPASGFLQGTPELLDENIRLLNSGVVRSKFGRFRGNILNQESYNLPEADVIANQFFKRKFHDPDGFVYRWKEGIGVRTLFGEPHNPELFRKETSPSLTADPFAGQDVMNVLSLLITGQPYNFNTFFRSAILIGNLSREDLSNTDGTRSFLRGLVNDLLQQNQTWGNFQPFKKMSINEGAYNFLRTGEFDLSATNRQLSELLRQRAEKFDELTTIVPQFSNQPQFYRVGLQGQKIVDGTNLLVDSIGVSKLGEQIINLDFQIQQAQNDFQQHVQEANLSGQDGALKIFGDDISFDSTLTTQTTLTSAQRLKQQQELRNRLLTLTYRPLWKVKANQDSNYFIVDDSYDKNYDIQAFEKALTNGLQTFRSTYTNVFQQIQSVSQLLGLEVFCDSQGHIQARAPQYNRMPSSVFQRMMQNVESKGIQIFPEFLQNLFFNQIQGLTDKLEIVEDEIRLRTILLGAKNDQSAKNILYGSTLGAQGSREFVFLTNPSDGKFGSKDIRSILVQNYPELGEDALNQGLNALTQSLRPANLSSVNFDILQRISIVNPSSGFSLLDTETESFFNQIAKRLENKTGNSATKISDLLPNDRTERGPGISQLDLITITDQLAQFISERQSIISLLVKSTQNLSAGISINQNASKLKTFLYSSLIDDKNMEYPDILAHMIEDENFDDLGPGAGERFILNDSRILSLTITENPPDWTLVEVNGQLENNLVPLPGGALSGIGSDGGGNGIATAFAVDYDMWRQYGFRSPHSVTIPFFSNAESQCAPYAVYLLNLARKNIFRADCSTIGNEFYQPGEVYYLEDRDLLFYVDSVSHSYTEGGNFTSSLRLSYGHTPGEYIPNMLDILGKALYTRQNPDSLIRHVRFGEIDNERNLNALYVSQEIIKQTDSVDALLLGPLGEENRKTLSNLLLGSLGYLLPNSTATNFQLEIRCYYNSAKGIQVSANISQAADAVAKWIIHPENTLLTKEGLARTTESNNQKTSLAADQIVVRSIDLSDDNITTSPSRAAWNLVRLSLLHSFGNISEEMALYDSIIDLFVVFSTPDKQVFTNPTPTVPNQAQEAEKAKYIAAFKSSIGQSS